MSASGSGCSGAWPGSLSKSVSAKFAALPLAPAPPGEFAGYAGPVCVEYIWVTRGGVAGAANPAQAMRSKTRVLPGPPPVDVAAVPPWSSDGLSANQGTAEERLPYTVEVVLAPVLLADDPFRGRPHKLALCEARLRDGRPTPSNTRAELARLAGHPAAAPEDVWLGFEAESAVFEPDKRHPLGWPPFGKPDGQTLYLNYCGIGGDAVGRDVLESHLRAALYAGLHVCGANLEVLVGSTEYQLAPLPPLRAADEAWLGRYLLARVCEEYGVSVTFDPKPVADADGCALHTNVSTASSRAAGGAGWAALRRYMALLGATHKDHLAVYGPGLERRLIGREEYSSMDAFTWGVGDRSASVRIPFESARDGGGYFEDRRPGANADPYQVAARHLRTLVVGPADPDEDPGSKLAAALAAWEWQLAEEEAGAARETAQQQQQQQQQQEQRAVDLAAAAKETTEHAEAEEAGLRGGEGVTAGGSQADRPRGQPEQPTGTTAGAAGAARSPTVRQLLARSHVALAHATDTHPGPSDHAQRVAETQQQPGGGDGGGGARGDRGATTQGKRQQQHPRRTGSGASLSLDEALDAARRRLSAATDGGEGHP